MCVGMFFGEIWVIVVEIVLEFYYAGDSMVRVECVGKYG